MFNYIKDADCKRKKLQRLSSSQNESIRRMDDSVTSPHLSSIESEKKRRKIF